MMHQVYYTHLQEEYTETYTRFYNGENRKFSSLHLQWMEYSAVLFRLLTLLIFLNFISFPTSLLPPMGYFIISCFFFHTPPSPECSLFVPLSSRIPWQPKNFFPPLFCSSCHLVFYKHNMYRNSTQTNMFLNFFFFFISKYNSFLWVLNSPHEPATYIHNDFFCVFFLFLLMNYSNHPFEVQVLAVFTHKAHTTWAGSFGACMHASCARASHMPACVPVDVMWCACVFQIYMSYRVCSEWHLHVTVRSDPPRPDPSSGIYIRIKTAAVGYEDGGAVKGLR